MNGESRPRAAFEVPGVDSAKVPMPTDTCTRWCRVCGLELLRWASETFGTCPCPSTWPVNR